MTAIAIIAAWFVGTIPFALLIARFMRPYDRPRSGETSELTDSIEIGGASDFIHNGAN